MSDEEQLLRTLLAQARENIREVVVEQRAGADGLRAFRFHAHCQPLNLPKPTEAQWREYWRNY